jgi:hypothetical protein
MKVMAVIAPLRAVMSTWSTHRKQKVVQNLKTISDEDPAVGQVLNSAFKTAATNTIPQKAPKKATRGVLMKIIAAFGAFPLALVKFILRSVKSGLKDLVLYFFLIILMTLLMISFAAGKDTYQHMKALVHTERDGQWSSLLNTKDLGTILSLLRKSFDGSAIVALYYLAFGSKGLTGALGIPLPNIKGLALKPKHVSRALGVAQSLKKRGLRVIQ